MSSWRVFCAAFCIVPCTSSDSQTALGTAISTFCVVCFFALVCKTLRHASSAAPKALVQGLCPICNTFLAKLSKQAHSRSMPSVAASACLPACLSACLPACLSACMPACLVACLFSCLLACRPAYLPPAAAPLPTYKPNKPSKPSPLPYPFQI